VYRYGVGLPAKKAKIDKFCLLPQDLITWTAFKMTSGEMRSPCGTTYMSWGLRDLSISCQKADKQVSHGQVVSVMDTLRQVQRAKLAIAAQKP
jgi:hypothetical protein